MPDTSQLRPAVVSLGGGLTLNKDALNAQIDSTIKEASPSTSTAAKKLTDGIQAFKKLF